jgi:hypothetical protein
VPTLPHSSQNLKIKKVVTNCRTVLSGSGVKVGKNSTRKKPFPDFFIFLKAQSPKALLLFTVSETTFAFRTPTPVEAPLPRLTNVLTNRTKHRFRSVLRPLLLGRLHKIPYFCRIK